MSRTANVAVVGDYKPDNRTHVATTNGLRHAARVVGAALDLQWVPTSRIKADDPADTLDEFDALFVAPGSPYTHMEGVLSAIRFAREKGRALAATCGGFQHVVLEYGRNVMAIADADSQEHGSGSKNLMVTACELPQRQPGQAMVDRQEAVNLKHGSHAAKVFGRDSVTEEYLCNYEFNREYQEQVDAAGLKVVGVDERGVGRIVELPEHRFFIATLFLPQLKSSDARPHPYLVGFLEVASHGKPKGTSTARIG